jgi:hypothetical protein
MVIRALLMTDGAGTRLLLRPRRVRLDSGWPLRRCGD